MTASASPQPPGRTPDALDATQREQALRHFEANLDRIAWLLRGTPVVVSTVASDLNIAPTERCLAEGCPHPIWARAQNERDPLRRRELLVEAKDLDPMSIRAPSEVNTILRRVADRHGLLLMDLEAELPRARDADVPDSALFRDTLHFSDQGMFEVADTVAAWLRDRQLP